MKKRAKFIVPFPFGKNVNAPMTSKDMYVAADAILNNFVWCETSLGVDYWSDVYENLLALGDQLKEAETGTPVRRA